MARRRLPPAAPERPTIRVVCPSAALTPPQLDRALAELAHLEALGCHIRFDESHATRVWRGYYAGTDGERLEAFVAACTEPGVDVVWWARGGGGAGRIAEAAAAALSSASPRIVMGFSDATSMLAALGRRLGWVTFHGPVITSLGRADVPHTLAVLRGEARVIPFPATAGAPLTGVLRGGNLMTLASLAGRDVLPRGRRTLWVLEEIDEADRRVDRCLEQLRAAGAFDGAAGVWVGGLYAEAQLDRVAEETGLPVVAGAPADHVGPMAPLPLGARVALEPALGRLRGLHPWVAHA
ncbi:MAG: LD-carboxypeptidase [Myxococcales bacterium]|nr:LD-carboxypeptidase [Myxococcales bacterium]